MVVYDVRLRGCGVDGRTHLKHAETPHITSVVADEYSKAVFRQQVFQSLNRLGVGFFNDTRFGCMRRASRDCRDAGINFVLRCQELLLD